MNIGISCKKIKDFDDSLRMIEDNNLSHIELQVNSIEKDSFIYSDKVINSICEQCKKLGITLSVHSFTGINLSEKVDRIRNEIIKITKEIIDITEYMSGTHLVLHLGNAGVRFDNIKKLNRLDITINTIDELEKYSRNMKMNIALENVDRLENDIKCYLGDCIEDFEYIYKKIEYPDTKMIFDIGHMNLSPNAELSAKRFLDTYNDNITAVHLHTNNGLVDQHLGIDDKWFKKYEDCLGLFDKLVILENYDFSEMEKTLTNIKKHFNYL